MHLPVWVWPVMFSLGFKAVQEILTYHDLKKEVRDCARRMSSMEATTRQAQIAQEDRGLRVERAVSYLCGCIEQTIPGKTDGARRILNGH